MIWKALPLGAQQFAICFSFIALLSCFIFMLLTKLDHMLAEDKKSPPSSAIGGVALVSLCLSVILIVRLASWIQLPGHSGTVQLFVNDPNSMFVFRLRGAVALSLVGAPIVCGILNMLCINKERVFFRGWIFAGILSYLFSWFVIVSTGFIPMV